MIQQFKLLTNFYFDYLYQSFNYDLINMNVLEIISNKK